MSEMIKYTETKIEQNKTWTLDCLSTDSDVQNYIKKWKQYNKEFY